MAVDIEGKRILILGAGLWQVPYLKKARELGLEVFATDWSEDAVGRSWASYFEAIDLRDIDGTIEFAKRCQVDAIFTAADIGVSTAAVVAEKLGLSFHSMELAEAATDKHLMRRVAQSQGIPIPQFCEITNFDDLEKKASSIGFPCIVKPTDNCSSRGVFFVDSLEELKERLPASFEASRSGALLLEEFMQGREGSAEALVVDGKVHLLGFCDKLKSPLPYRFDLQLNYPGRFSDAEGKMIVDLVEKIASGYSVKTGILHVEFVMKEDGIGLIEFAVRGCGSNVITHLMPAITGFDCAEWLLKAAFGIEGPVDIEPSKAGILKFIMLPDREIDSVAGVDKVFDTEGIVDFHLDREPGQKVGEIIDGRSRPGHIIGVGESIEEAQNNIKNALEALQIEYT